MASKTRPEDIYNLEDNTTRGVELSPEYESLQRKLSLLTEEVAFLLEEKEFLLKTQKPNLLAEYQLKLGYKELELFNIKAAALRIKRKIELIQSCINQDKEPVMDDIEEQLAREFTEWSEIIRKKKIEIDQAEGRLRGGFLSTEETRDLRKLYRKLAKKLHPDLNPNQSAEEEVLWVKIVEAYSGNDWEEFKTLAMLAEELTQTEDDRDTMEQLRNKCRVLKARITELSKTIQDIYSKFPFNIKEKLTNEEWLNSRRDRITEEIMEWKKRYTFYREHLMSILPGQTDDSQFMIH